MRQVDSFKRRYAAMLNDKTRESLVLPGRESAIGLKALVTRHESGPGNY